MYCPDQESKPRCYGHYSLSHASTQTETYCCIYLYVHVYLVVNYTPLSRHHMMIVNECHCHTSDVGHFQSFMNMVECGCQETHPAVEK